VGRSLDGQCGIPALIIRVRERDVRDLSSHTYVYRRYSRGQIAAITYTLAAARLERSILQLHMMLNNRRGLGCASVCSSLVLVFFFRGSILVPPPKICKKQSATFRAKNNLKIDHSSKT